MLYPLSYEGWIGRIANDYRSFRRPGLRPNARRHPESTPFPPRPHGQQRSLLAYLQRHGPGTGNDDVSSHRVMQRDLQP